MQIRRQYRHLTYYIIAHIINAIYDNCKSYTFENILHSTRMQYCQNQRLTIVALHTFDPQYPHVLLRSSEEHEKHTLPLHQEKKGAQKE